MELYKDRKGRSVVNPAEGVLQIICSTSIVSYSTNTEPIKVGMVKMDRFYSISAICEKSWHDSLKIHRDLGLFRSKNPKPQN
jgi:hypothetical protein